MSKIKHSPQIEKTTLPHIEKINEIRFLQKLLAALALSFFIIVMAYLWNQNQGGLLSESFFALIATLWVVSLGLFTLRLFSRPCPACDQLFFFDLIYMNPWLKQCKQCGHPLEK